MAVIETHNSNTVTLRPGFFSLSSVVATVIAWNERRMTRKVLSQLTTRELEDIGLSRGDIEAL